MKMKKNVLGALWRPVDSPLQMIGWLMFQIETIGDAYCVAGGLHRASRYHAQQIAWMALKMMGGANKEKAHDQEIHYR